MCRLNVDAGVGGDYEIGYNGFGYFWFFFCWEKKRPEWLNHDPAGFFFIFDETAVGEEL